MRSFCISGDAPLTSSWTSGLIAFLLLSPTTHAFVKINPYSKSLKGQVTTNHNHVLPATFCWKKGHAKSFHLPINGYSKRSALHATTPSFLKKLISPKSSKNKKDKSNEIENASTLNITKADVVEEKIEKESKPDPKSGLQIEDETSEQLSNKENDDNNQSPKPLAPTKIRQLKDRMWVRETLEDLTSSEFACTLNRDISNNSNNSNITSQDKKLFPPMKIKRAVDFEALLQKLDRRIEEMCVVGDVERDESSCFIAEIQGEEMCFVLKENKGMGSVVYTQDQRESLLE